MTCTNCANTIQRRLNKVDGVVEPTVNYANEKATVTYVPGAVDRADLVAAVRKAGYDVVETARRRRAAGCRSRGARRRDAPPVDAADRGRDLYACRCSC